MNRRLPLALLAMFVALMLLLSACGSASTSSRSQVPSSTVKATDKPVPPTNTAKQPTASPTPSEPQWPSARKYGAMVYEPTSERLLLFGGVEQYSAFVTLREVWSYDPGIGGWQQRGRLPLRDVNCATVDEESRRVIVFGQDYAKKLGETWSYDPAADTWELMQPDTAPTARYGSLMAYDSESDRVVLFGGGTSPSNCFDDTWIYDVDGDTWTEMHPEVAPPQRGYHGMAYAPEIDRVLMWGGTTPEDVEDLRVWTYDYNSNTWTAQDAPPDAPEQRAGYGLFYHPPSGRLIMYGGLSEWDLQPKEEITWAYDHGANTWKALPSSENPGKRSFALVAYADSIDKAVMFGGEMGAKQDDNISDELWLFDPSIDEWMNMTRQ